MVFHLAAIITSCVGITSCGVTSAPLVPCLDLWGFRRGLETRQWPNSYGNLRRRPYARHTGVKDADRSVALLYHLGGYAMEEVFCQPGRVRQNCKALVALLLRRFGPPETIQSHRTSNSI